MGDSEKENSPHIGSVIPQKAFILFDWHEFVCGCGAAFCNLLTLYPYYKLIYRQMLTGIRLRTAFAEIKGEGMAHLYRGIFPPLIQKSCTFSIMFGIYDGSRRGMMHYYDVDTFYAKVFAGIVAGICEGAFVPFERIQTLLVDPRHYSKFNNTIGALRYVLVNHGFLELYRGVIPVISRNGPANAAFFVLREEAYRQFPGNVLLRNFFSYFTGAYNNLVGCVDDCLNI